MSSYQIAEYFLWKIIKRGSKKEGKSWKTSPMKEEVIYLNEMICRVCTNAANIPITDKIGDISILRAIRNVANVTITDNDYYPKYICKNCLEDLKVALTFKQKCESSDLMFRRSAGEESVASISPPVVFHDFGLILHQMRQRRLSLQRSLELESKRTVKTSEFLEESVAINTSEKTIKCKKCDLIFDTKELLVEHRKQQDHNRICLPCPFCGKLVTNMSRHKKIVHLRNDTHTCHICGKVFYSSGALRNHLVVHSDNFEYHCKLCPYKGKHQAYLTLHMRVHTGERPYLCSKCPAKFVNPSNLKKHQLTHSNKKFECNKCKKRFRLQKTLQEHYDAAHLNMRYRCSICGRDLWTRRKLLSHEIRVHNREKRKLYDETCKIVINNEDD